MSSQLVQHSRMQRFIKFLHIFHIVTIPRNAISDHVQSRRKWEILLFFVAMKRVDVVERAYRGANENVAIEFSV